MRNLLAACCFVLFGSLASLPAQAQAPATVKLCNGGQPNCPVISSGNPLPVTGTFSASLGGFVPSLSYTTLTATASSSASTALPTNTGTVAFQNQTTAPVSCTLASGAATATTNEILVPAGSTIFVGTTGYDHAACINQTGSASNVIVLAGGSGLGTGFGGGGSGSGGAVTLASGVPDTTETFSIGSSTQSAALTLFGTQSVQFNLTGTFSATVFGQVSNDNSTWVNVPLLNMTTGLWVAPGTGVTAVGNYALVGTQGARYARVNVTYTSGTVAGNLTATSQAASATWGDYLTYQGLTGPIGALAATAWNTNTYNNGNTSQLNTNLNGDAFVSQAPAAPILVSLQTAAVANGNGNNLNVTGTAGAVLTVNCATCSGGTQVNFQISQDGTNFASINAIQLPGSSAPATNTTTPGVTLWSIQVPAGATALRATVSAYSAGTVTVTGEAVPVGNGLPSASIAANGGTLGTGQALVKGTTAAMTGTSPTQIIAAVTGQRIYPNRYKCNNSSSTDTLVQITDGSAGTVLDTLQAKAGAGEVSSGYTPLTWTTSGNGLFAQDVTTGASVICSASGYSGG